MRRFCRVRTWLFVGAMSVCVLASPTALADDDDDDRAKNWAEVSLLERKKPLYQWLAGCVFIVGCLAVAFKHPHRSHLD